MSGLVDDATKERVSNVATDYEEVVSVYEEPISSFSDFQGHSDSKEEIRSKIISRMELGTYAPSSLLLHAQEHTIVSEHLAKGISGELPPSWTTYHLHGTNSKVKYKTNALESVLTEARTAEPSVVLIECLDDYDFGESRYEGLKQFISEIRVDDSNVLIVGLTADIDSELLANESIFEVVHEVPEPDRRFRQWVIERELENAANKGVITKPTHLWETDPEIQTVELDIDRLKIGVKRAIQRRMHESEEHDAPPIHPEHIEASLERLEAETLDKAMTAWGMEVDEKAEEYKPEIPSITFSDIGGLETEKQRLREAVSSPVEHSDIFEDAGYSVGQGILLYGPPGNGKTMLAKAVANELSYRFFAVKGPEMEGPLVGETERKIRELFEAARENAPSVIFFDEFDSVAPDRDSVGDSYKQDQVNALLAELDGMDTLEEVIVLAATNRMEKLDDAVLRSGRFDTLIEISTPNMNQKQKIFELEIQQLATASNVTAEWFGTLEIDELSGADIATICRKALEMAVAEFDSNSRGEIVITRTHIKAALSDVSVTEDRRTHRTGFH